MTRNSETLADFVAYCEAHPSERFWQALRNWSEFPYILAAHSKPPMTNWEDTFYWEGRNEWAKSARIEYLLEKE